MIDTGKYEGHSKGPWYWDGNLCNDEHSDKRGVEQWAVLDWELGVGDADKQLIADAPLLLAEVKRLRGVIAKVWDLIQNSNHEEREMFFWGFDKKNTGWIKRYEELAMKELNWDWWGEEE